MKKILIASMLIASLTACGQADKDDVKRLQEQVAKLQGEVVTLKSELDAERNGPERLLARAKNESVQTDLAPAKQTLNDLIAKYPESPQAQNAKGVLSEIAAKSEAIEKAKLLEAAKAAEEQRKILARLDSNLKKNTDEIKGITWISHKSEPVLANYMALYFGTKDGVVGSYPLRMKFNYYAEDWLFVQSITIKADDQVFNLEKVKFERDNAAGSIWEWSDSPVESMAMLNQILAAKKVVIRYNGRQYYHDFALPEAQKTAMKEILVAWQRYGGKA
jgi:hypothetical protein